MYDDLFAVIACKKREQDPGHIHCYPEFHVSAHEPWRIQADHEEVFGYDE